MPPTTDDLEAADDELWSALLHADADAIEAITDPEATVAFELAELHHLEDLLHALRTGRLRVTEAEFERRRVRIAGELGITTVIATVAATHGGAPLRARLRFVRTWRLDASWVLVAASSTLPRERS